MPRNLRSTLLATFCGLMLSAPASRAEDIAPEGVDELCGNIGMMAGAAMQGRQNGAQMSALMAAVAAQPETPVRDLSRAAITAAYAQPRFSTAEMQRRAVEDFRAAWELLCYQSLSGEAQ